MKLIIGGYAQGKLNYVLQRYAPEKDVIMDGMLPENTEDLTGRVIINHFHSWVKNSIAKGKCPEKDIASFLEKHPDCIIISDEIGSGIVPIDGAEREYRERTGRILVKLADRAEEVVRVICGIGQKIK